jgi:hypothetical protein
MAENQKRRAVLPYLGIPGVAILFGVIAVAITFEIQDRRDQVLTAELERTQSAARVNDFETGAHEI